MIIDGKIQFRTVGRKYQSYFVLFAHINFEYHGNDWAWNKDKKIPVSNLGPVWEINLLFFDLNCFQ